MFYLPQLQYEYDALGGYISRDIMLLHYTKHHQGYIDKLNNSLEGSSAGQDVPVESLLRKLDSLPDGIRNTVRNNGGGHYNHSLFWDIMSPNGGGEPRGDVMNAILEKHGSFQQFVDTFTTESLNVFGSGWCWLMPNGDITTTPNQDSPIMFGGAEPLLGLDVWEHAYYLDYQNKRADYIAAWWNVVDWDAVSLRLQRLSD